ncbi:hypothetical protein [Synoicihabitans lomoniglobus]|uniref:AsmA-like C-terminal domain-containing protein n=1 Tax=Synoicihabitans lomoniglobus TaxID=2909285 RepID=A0AAF0CRE4_9BACT|nr:hypothetical protein [Opitutaceae bacterium LMO-M01]WED66683.1 hypothetical protein PXH66_07445 [Opitutaceae bacterium LMO-M01]
MKRRRGILIGIGATIGVVALFVVLAFLPPIQKWIVTRALAGQPDLVVEFDAIAVRPSSITIEALDVQQGAVRFRAPVVKADLPVWKLLGKTVQLERLVATDWTVHYEPMSEMAETAPVSPRVATASLIPMLFAQAAPTGQSEVGLAQIREWMTLPVALSIGHVDLRGSASWRNAGPGADGQAQVAISGGNLGVGRPGQFAVDVSAAGDAAGASVIRSLDVHAQIELVMQSAHSIGHASIKSTLTGRRANVDQVDQFELSLVVDDDVGGPALNFVLSDQVQRLVDVSLAADLEADLLAGNWRVQLNTTSLQSLMLGTPLPQFDVGGGGTWSADWTLSDAEIEGELAYAVSELDSLMPPLASIGELKGDAKFAGQRKGGDLRVTVLDVTVDGAAPVAHLRLLQGVELGMETFEVRVASPENPVFDLEFLGLPASWTQPWLEPWVLDAHPIRGHLTGLVTPHGVRVVTSEPLRIDGLMVAGEGRTYLDEVDVAIGVGAEVTNEGWQIELDRVEIGDATGMYAALSARGGHLTRDSDVMKLVGSFEADLAALHRLPILEGQALLQAGRLRGEFGLGLEDRVSLAATLGITGLVMVDGEPLPDVQLDGRVDLLGDGAIEAHLPIRITQGERVSDLTLNMRAQPENDGWRADGSLSGPRAYVADLQILGAPFAISENQDDSPTSPPVTSPVPDGTSGQPVWSGVTGIFKTAIGQLILPNGMTLEDVRGDLTVTPDRVEMTGLSADVTSGGSFGLDGQIAFSPDGADAYAAGARIKAQGVEMAPLLRIFQPDTAPVFEGKLNATADITSVVATLDQLADHAAVSAQVTSAGGVLRALGVQVEQYIQTGKTVAAIGGLLAMATGNSRAADYATKVQAVTAVAEQLSVLAFDQLNLEVTRAAAGDVTLSDLSVISPGFRLLGSGRINYQPETPVWLQPLAVSLQLSAREKMATDLTTLRLLRAEPDALGYLPLVQSVKLDGTLAKIGTAEIERLLTRALQRP